MIYRHAVFAVSILVCLSNLYFIRFDAFNTGDMNLYISQYYSEYYSNWHRKEFLFWAIYRFFSIFITAEFALILIDLILLSVCCLSFRFYGLKGMASITCGLLVFCMFPLIFGRLGAYRQYWAMVVALFLFSYLFKVSRSKNQANASKFYVLAVIPILIHNGAVCLLLVFSSFFRISIGYIIGSFVVLGAVYYLMFFQGTGAGDLVLDKLVRDRESSGTLRTEYIYLVTLLLMLIVSHKDYKSFVGGQLLPLLVVFGLFYIVAELVFSTSSLYLERVGMNLLIVLFPIVIVSNMKEPTFYKSTFVAAITIFPVLFPAIQLITMGYRIW